MSRGDQPIGVLDSGLGGLSLVKALRRILPFEAMVYLGDTARGPYGDKTPAAIAQSTLQAGAALARHQPKLLVIACSSAAAHGLAALQAAVDCPVIGVIEPGAQALAAITGPVGIIGPGAAIASGAYEEAVRRRRPEAVVHTLACPLLESLAEAGWLDDPIADAICRRYLNQIPFEAHTVLLASNRYPALLPSLSRIRTNTRFLDGGELTAQAVEQLLQGGLGFRTVSARGELQVLLTDLTDRARDLGAQYLGEPLAQLEAVTV